MSFGLRRDDLEYIRIALSRFPAIEKAAIFGSRAKGTHKPGSDVDIAIWGQGVDLSTVAHLKGMLEDEGPLPYFFDIVDYTHLDHAELREHIDRVGKVIYSRF